MNEIFVQIMVGIGIAGVGGWVLHPFIQSRQENDKTRPHGSRHKS